MAINTQYTPVIPVEQGFAPEITFSYVGYLFNQPGIAFNTSNYALTYAVVEDPDSKYSQVGQPETAYTVQEQ